MLAVSSLLAFLVFVNLSMAVLLHYILFMFLLLSNLFETRFGMETDFSVRPFIDTKNRNEDGIYFI